MYPVAEFSFLGRFPAGVPWPGDGAMVGGAAAVSLGLRSACSISLSIPSACSRVWASRGDRNPSWVASAACRGGRLRLAVRADLFTVVIELARNFTNFFLPLLIPVCTIHINCALHTLPGL